MARTKRQTSAVSKLDELIANFQDGVRKAKPLGRVRQVQARNAYVRGVKRAKSAWLKAWRPYYNVLRKLELAPRGPIRSPQNSERCRLVCEALHTEKMRRLAAKGQGRTAAAKSSPRPSVKALKATAGR